MSYKCIYMCINILVLLVLGIRRLHKASLCLPASVFFISHHLSHCESVQKPGSGVQMPQCACFC